MNKKYYEIGFRKCASAYGVDPDALSQMFCSGSIKQASFWDEVKSALNKIDTKARTMWNDNIPPEYKKPLAGALAGVGVGGLGGAALGGLTGIGAGRGALAGAGLGGIGGGLYGAKINEKAKINELLKRIEALRGEKKD